MLFPEPEGPSTATMRTPGTEADSTCTDFEQGDRSGDLSSSAEEQGLTKAINSPNPFPGWGYLLSSLPPVALIALGVFVVVGLAALITWIAIAVRRLDDTNRSG